MIFCCNLNYLSFPFYECFKINDIEKPFPIKEGVGVRPFKRPHLLKATVKLQNPLAFSIFSLVIQWKYPSKLFTAIRLWGKWKRSGGNNFKYIRSIRMVDPSFGYASDRNLSGLHKFFNEKLIHKAKTLVSS